MPFKEDDQRKPHVVLTGDEPLERKGLQDSYDCCTSQGRLGVPDSIIGMYHTPVAESTEVIRI